MSDQEKGRIGWFRIVFGLAMLAAVAIIFLERGSRWLLDKQVAMGGKLPYAYTPLAEIVNGYLKLRAHLASYWPLYAIALVLTAAGIYRGLKVLSALWHKARAKQSGFQFEQEEYGFPKVDFFFKGALKENPRPQEQIVLGCDRHGGIVHISDQARSMHVHLLGQTGTGKTKGAIEPMMFQDIYRKRGVLIVDGKGSEENEERLLGMAAKAGRLSRVKVFTLNPDRKSHSYNPVHIPKNADPQFIRAVAERVFSSFADDMDVPYYRDQSRLFFVSLVDLLASTGKRFCMLDIKACIASRQMLGEAMSLAEDKTAIRSIEAQLAQLGASAGQTFTGLLAAVSRYDSDALNAYDPDIVLEDEIDRGGIVAFYLQSNFAKQLARYVGLCVFQHLQQVGSMRQMNRKRPQTPLYVYADEFYSFAYEGFTDAVNKLRDAHISILLSHQTFSDLEKVSPEFAKGISDNTRNKIILYQNDPEACERLAGMIGTVKDIELTIRQSADGFWNRIMKSEASSREVDKFKWHPNRPKHLETGQCYLIKDATFVGVNLKEIPALEKALLPRGKRPSADGIGLWKKFLKAPKPDGGPAPGPAPSSPPAAASPTPTLDETVETTLPEAALMIQGMRKR